MSRLWRQASLAAVFCTALCLIDASPAAAQPKPGLRGQLTFASGKPAAGVFVQARPLGQSPALPDIGIFTNKSGAFFWPLPAGRFELTFIHRGQKLAVRQVEVAEGRTARMDVRLSAPR